MGLKALIERLAAEHDEDVDDDLKVLFADESIDFDDPLPGTASERIEVFSDEAFSASKPDADGLIWSPMIRAGQWALRPGPNGQKRRVPLKVVAGKSKNARKELGLEDLLEAFNDEAVENVTVPTSHSNHVLENTGFIKKMKIMDLEVAKGPNKGKKVPHLVGGYDFTEPDVKGKAQRGTIAGRSCGILYDYSNTETGKTYLAVVEHVALTNKPWITGMQSFGRKLALSDDVETVAMVFSDTEPTEDQLSIMDADEFATETDGVGTISWNHEDSPNWLREQVNNKLSEARQDKLAAKRKSAGDSYLYESVPYYRCIEAKSGTSPAALISDGYGDGANHWVVALTVSDGTVEVPQFSEWNAVKQVFVPDDRDPPEKKNEPLSLDPPKPLTARERLARASARRQARITNADSLSETIDHPKGGDHSMNTEGGGTSAMELSETAQKAIDEANARAKRAEEALAETNARVERLFKREKDSEADRLAGVAKSLFGEDQAGALAYLRNVCLADDGETAVASEAFSEDGKTEVGLTATEMFSQFFEALKKGEDGKVALSAQVETEGEKPKDEPNTKLSEEEQVKPRPDGKPAVKEGETELSEEEQAKARADEMLSDPRFARGMGLEQSTNGDKGGES